MGHGPACNIDRKQFLPPATPCRILFPYHKSEISRARTAWPVGHTANKRTRSCHPRSLEYTACGVPRRPKSRLSLAHSPGRSEIPQPPRRPFCAHSLCRSPSTIIGRGIKVPTQADMKIVIYDLNLSPMTYCGSSSSLCAPWAPRGTQSIRCTHPPATGRNLTRLRRRWP
ncbi:hypothetical protein BDY21DRAFT_167076 [Lineolata rhizophorae]|uniref:Uncharacterized protein n=1 Tax=Lineolata rhizophorae TaxID=578093 RepID=A0A6A6P9G8_9PEZI|nr:hypothetical protein BDY21DRAFT_167076 [Lineolata rhizophorae]